MSGVSNQCSSCVGVIGMGYVGLPLAIAFAEQGCRVIGFDVDDAKVAALQNGRSYIKHIPDERLASLTDLRVTADFTEVSACDSILICVPTPLDRHLEPDLRYIESTCISIAPHLAPGTLVVLESTTWPGTTREMVLPLLEQNGPRRLGSDLFVAYSPEREDPGNAHYDTRSIPKLVGGLDDASTQRAADLYHIAVSEVVPVSSPRVAEAAKLFENIFRSVNIALVNELKMILDPMDIDVWEVIGAAATKPFGFMPFWPGPGLGGHCIPIDPFYLSWKAKEHGVVTRFIELAGEINRSMPDWVVRKVQDCLNDYAKPVKGSRILILGLAYKADVDDMRESPSLVLIEKLEAMGASVDYHDPNIPLVPHTREHDHLAGRTSCEPASLYDCFVLATAHHGYDQSLLTHGVPIVDTRNQMQSCELVRRA